MAKRPIVSEGELFAVPLDRGGYAIGLIIRIDGNGGAIAHFFGPKRADASLLPHEQFTVDSSVYATIFGTTAIEIGAWPRLGLLPGFSKSDWPIPIMASKIIVGSEMPRQCYEYLDDGTLWNRREVECPDDMTKVVGEDGGAPNGYVEDLLTDIVDPPWWQQP